MFNTQHRIDCDEKHHANISVLNGLFTTLKPKATFTFEECISPVITAIKDDVIKSIPLDGFNDAVLASKTKVLAVVQQWLDHPESKPPGMTADHVAAIALYSYPSLDYNHSFFKALNLILRLGSRDEIRPFLHYCWLLLLALECLPELEPTITVYRGIAGELDLQVGSEVKWFAFSSTSPNLDVQNNYCQLEPSKIHILFIINLSTRRGKCIKPYSLVGDEDEILLPPNSRFIVKSIGGELVRGNTWIVTLQEIPSDDPILHYGETYPEEVLTCIHRVAACHQVSHLVEYINCPDANSCDNILVFKTLLETMLSMLNDDSAWDQLCSEACSTYLWPRIVVWMERHTHIDDPSATSTTTTTDPQLPQAVALAEVGVSLFRKLCRRGQIQDASGHQEAMISCMSACGVMGVAVTILRNLGPKNSRIAVQCLALLHFMIYDSSRGRTEEEIASNLLTLCGHRPNKPNCQRLVERGGAGLILASLASYGASNRYIANHGLWCLYHLRSYHNCLNMLHSEENELIVRKILDHYSNTISIDCSSTTMENEIIHDMVTDKDILPFLLLGKPEYVEKLYTGMRNYNLTAKHKLILFADSGNRYGEAFAAVALLIHPPKVDANCALGAEYAERCWHWLQRSTADDNDVIPAVAFCKGMLLRESVPGYIDQHAQTAFKLLLDAAEKDYILAQVSVAVCFQNGQGVAQNTERAFHWLTTAANNGSALARCNLGWYYQEGVFVEKDLNRAIDCYKSASVQGISMAAYYIGNLMENENELSDDATDAVHWYKHAARSGYPDAQYVVGCNCQENNDDDDAVLWYGLAAAQGHTHARDALASFTTTL